MTFVCLPVLVRVIWWILSLLQYTMIIKGTSSVDMLSLSRLVRTSIVVDERVKKKDAVPIKESPTKLKYCGVTDTKRSLTWNPKSIP